MTLKQKMKRAIWMIVYLMVMVNTNAATFVTVDGLEYILTGTYASVFDVASGNNSKKITIPATIMSKGKLIDSTRRIYQANTDTSYRHTIICLKAHD